MCPVYSAGEKLDKNYSQISFSKIISKNSNVQVINVKNQEDIKKYLQKNLIKDEIIIGMGAGTISQWMRDLQHNL